MVSGLTHGNYQHGYDGYELLGNGYELDAYYGDVHGHGY